MQYLLHISETAVYHSPLQPESQVAILGPSASPNLVATAHRRLLGGGLHRVLEMAPLKTRVLPVTSINPPHVNAETDPLEWFNNNRDALPQDQVDHLLQAAHALQTSSIPVAFPTETVYGLGADATRSDAVRGIFTAKQRPSDNPLIVHVGSLDQLRTLLGSSRENGHSASNHSNGTTTSTTGKDDPIPPIYHSLIRRFWPGPLTLLFSLPSPSPFAPEVHPSLNTVGIRMPSSPLARLLISLSNCPLAAPSANASTRPSPTTARHVLQDLEGRVEIILDGGSCSVGVESTVVDGLGNGAPVVLRPGGVGIDEIRAVGGLWKDVDVGYEDTEQMREKGSVKAETNGHANNANGRAILPEVPTTTNPEPHAPRAPGMKYRHYAPRARVHLFEADPSASASSEHAARSQLSDYHNRHDSSLPPLKIGIIATRRWRPNLGLLSPTTAINGSSVFLPDDLLEHQLQLQHQHGPAPAVSFSHFTLHRHSEHDHEHKDINVGARTEVYSVGLGPGVEGVARGLFWALRELDGRGCDVIVIEGIGDREGDLAAAVMNRLRKAAAGSSYSGGGD